jgi:hypothetical protein
MSFLDVGVSSLVMCLFEYSASFCRHSLYYISGVHCLFVSFAVFILIAKFIGKNYLQYFLNILLMPVGSLLTSLMTWVSSVSR